MEVVERGGGVGVGERGRGEGWRGGRWVGGGDMHTGREGRSWRVTFTFQIHSP